ncbi:hypothetical protein PVK06_043961 [Gossypium arboreum]|uniref:Uncharacterized protein n=1 Tax=Gossypium arboreum TaxID=29729 RepID=A0ABR0MPY7_GOSAR|nr:hypothetical protein PVK06_043961 [Gossypium arboreum]
MRSWIKSKRSSSTATFEPNFDHSPALRLSRKRGGGMGVGRAPSELGWTSEVECIVTAGGCARAAHGVA